MAAVFSKAKFRHCTCKSIADLPAMVMKIDMSEAKKRYKTRLSSLSLSVSSPAARNDVKAFFSSRGKVSQNAHAYGRVLPKGLMAGSFSQNFGQISAKMVSAYFVCFSRLVKHCILVWPNFLTDLAILVIKLTVRAEKDSSVQKFPNSTKFQFWPNFFQTLILGSGFWQKNLFRSHTSTYSVFIP